MLTLMETAKTMIREALPIKCMEAVVLSIYLTNGVPCLGTNIFFKNKINSQKTSNVFFFQILGRFPINFKSELPARVGIPQKYFYHVVLGLVHGSKFGAIGKNICLKKIGLVHTNFKSSFLKTASIYQFVYYPDLIISPYRP